MALKDALALVDDKLQADFERKRPNVESIRTRVIKTLDKAKEQFASTEPTRGRKIWRENNGIVEFAPAFKVGGKSTLYLPAERFGGFLAKLRSAVEAGELDADITADGGVSGGTRKRSGGGGKGWSEERRARYAATMAARKK